MNEASEGFQTNRLCNDGAPIEMVRSRSVKIFIGSHKERSLDLSTCQRGKHRRWDETWLSGKIVESFPYGNGESDGPKKIL